MLKELKDRIGDVATIIKVDVDKSPQAAQQYQIQGVPTLILFKNGRSVWRQSGVRSLEELEKVIRQHV